MRQRILRTRRPSRLVSELSDARQNAKSCRVFIFPGWSRVAIRVGCSASPEYLLAYFKKSPREECSSPSTGVATYHP